MRLPLLVPLALGCTLALTGSAAARPKLTDFDYKIVSASHDSSVSEHGENYDGASSETWKLRGPSDGYPNETGGWYPAPGGKQESPLLFNIRGTYQGDVTAGPDAQDIQHCQATVSTGDQSDNAAVAPTSAQVVLVYDKRHKRVTGHWAFPMADLNPPIFQSECSHPETVFPTETYFRTNYPASRFARKRFTISNSGQPGGRYGSYRWKTTLTLVRQKESK